MQKKKLNNIIRHFEFALQGNYTYKVLYTIHPDWKLYFYNNTDPFGNPTIHDNRLGVEALPVDKAMRILRNKPYKTLDEALIIAYLPDNNNEFNQQFV